MASRHSSQSPQKKISARGEHGKTPQSAHTEFTKALSAAQDVSDPWYRCQALAAVARFAPEGDVVWVAEQAIKAAMLGNDSYKRSAVASWPLRALVERGKTSQAERVFDMLMEEVSHIEHPVCKTASLVSLWQALWPIDGNYKYKALDALLAACRVANSWKSGCIMRDAALVVAAKDKQKAQQIVESMRDSIYKRQAQRRLDAGQVETVRSFFRQTPA